MPETKIPTSLAGSYTILLKEGLYDMVLSRHVLSRAYSTFQDGDIWPDECEWIASELCKLKEKTLRVIDLFERLCHIQEQSSSWRYVLLTPINYILENLNRLIEQISIFRSLCRKSSRLSLLERKSIIARIELVANHIDDLPRMFDDILELGSKESPDQPIFLVRRTHPLEPHTA